MSDLLHPLRDKLFARVSIAIIVARRRQRVRVPRDTRNHPQSRDVKLHECGKYLNIYRIGRESAEYEKTNS